MKKRKTGAGRKLVSLLLMAAMLFILPGIPVLADTAGEAADAVKEGMSPVNPVHNCTMQNGGTDTTTWSYVYFGSYPQTEAAGDALTAAITEASYDANGDAWVNGTKYRRISKSDTNHGEYFGNSDYRYFKWERIRWRVLRVNDSTIFVMADKGLDCKCYNDIYTSVTWENCTLRNWLNNDFYGTAFSSSEQGAIVPQTVVNEDAPYYDTEGGNDTWDKVYLLSIGEVTNPSYGFCEDYFTNSVSREVKVSDYAYARGASVNIKTDYAENRCSKAYFHQRKNQGKIQKIIVEWKKQKYVSGYQIQFSTNKKFKKKYTVIKTVKKPSATKLTIKKLKPGKKYYVRIRTYQAVNGSTYYSGWSKTKTANIKK